MGDAKRREQLHEQAPHIAIPQESVPAVAIQRKILICTPAHDGKICTGTAISLMEAHVEAARHGWSVAVSFRNGDSLLNRGRDVLLSTFWYSDCTDMLFVDSDISWPIGAFAKIMSHPVDFVGGIYRSRGDPPLYVCNPLPGGMQVYYPSGLAEVKGVGTGFLRLTRAAVKRLLDYTPEDHWYVDKETAPGMKVHHLFDVTFDPRKDPGMRLESEDYVFCNRYRDAGGKVYADTELTLFHTGIATFEGHFGNHLRNGGGGAKVMPQTPVEAGAHPVQASVLDLARAAAE